MMSFKRAMTLSLVSKYHVREVILLFGAISGSSALNRLVSHRATLVRRNKNLSHLSFSSFLGSQIKRKCFSPTLLYDPGVDLCNNCLNCRFTVALPMIIHIGAIAAMCFQSPSLVSSNCVYDRSLFRSEIYISLFRLTNCLAKVRTLVNPLGSSISYVREPVCTFWRFCCKN